MDTNLPDHWLTDDWKDYFEEDEGSVSVWLPEYRNNPDNSIEYIAVYDHALSDDELITFYSLEEESDKLAPARGIVYTILFSSLFWLVVILLVYKFIL